MARTRNNLPRFRGEFIGRQKVVKEILEQLSWERRTWLVAIWGVGGVGKTALALHAARQLRGQNAFDAIVWTSSQAEILSGGRIRERKGPVLTNLDELLTTIGKVLRLKDVGTSLKERQKTITEHLKGQRVLIIVDNLESIDDRDAAKIIWFVRDLLPEPSKALVTSRIRFVGRGEYAIGLTGFSLEESIAFIRSEVRTGKLGSSIRLDHSTMRHIHDLTGGIPLAIKWVIGQAKGRTKKKMEDILDSLTRTKGEPLLEYCFRESFLELSRGAQDLMLSISTLRYPTNYEDIKRTSEFRDYQLVDYLDELVAMSLIEQTEKTRQYTMLPLTQAYARRQLNMRGG